VSVLVYLAVPVFFALILLEARRHRALRAAGRRDLVGYERRDTAASLWMGVGNVAVAAAVQGASVVVFFIAYEHRIFEIGTGAWAWVALFFAEDLVYYAFHRCSHEVRFLWAAHENHHSSQRYNLSTALRQSWTTPLTTVPFYVWLPLLGFHPLMVQTQVAVSLLYQFWIHTELVGRLGPLERVFNTPSHHRVHHGIDPRYIDRNYGGIFIFWDRLFGTFRREDREPVYGTVEPLSSWNPAWANVEHLVALARRARQTRRLRDKLLVWVMPPEWRPADLGGPVSVPEVSRESQVKHRASTPRGMNVYVTVGFVITAAALSALLRWQSAIDLPARAAAVVLLLSGLSVWGGLFEARRWAVPLEWARMAASVALAAWLVRGEAVFAPVVVAAAVAALVLSLWAARYRRPRPPLAERPAGAPFV